MIVVTRLYDSCQKGQQNEGVADGENFASTRYVSTKLTVLLVRRVLYITSLSTSVSQPRWEIAHLSFFVASNAFHAMS